MTDLPEIQTAYDMKAITVLTCCDIAEKLRDIGDLQGAAALAILIKAIEELPVAGDAND